VIVGYELVAHRYPVEQEEKEPEPTTCRYSSQLPAPAATPTHIGAVNPDLLLDHVQPDFNGDSKQSTA
jgi:hypothetical protein